MKPFGTAMKSQTVAARTTSEIEHRRRAMARAPSAGRARRTRAALRRSARWPGTCGRGCSLPCGRRNFADSSGVSESETKPETRIAAPIVTANSWKRRPRMPPMKRIGMKTAASEIVIDRIVKPISRRAVHRRLERLLAHLHVPDDVLQHDDRVVDDEADGERERHQREVVERVAAEVHHGERADDRHRQREAGDHRRREVSQEEEDDEDDQEERQQERELHVAHGVADRLRAIAMDLQIDRGGRFLLERREERADAVGDFDGIRARLLLHREDEAALAA